MKMISCPQCSGAKQITITVSEAGQPDTTFSMACPTCHGKGTVTTAQKKRYEQMMAAWCTCPTHGDPEYHPDTATDKHHWTCGNCGKLLQVG